MLQDKTLDKSTPVPLYYQLKSLILDEISSGEYKPGDMLPTELEIGEMFGISRTTVRQAITELAHDGYIYRVKSKGTFISEPKIEQRLLQDNTYYNSRTLDDDVEHSGRHPRTDILEVKEVLTPAELTHLGYRSESGKAIYLNRCRYADDIPFCRTISYMNYDKFKYLLTSDELYTKRLGEILNSDPDTTVARIMRTFEALTAEKEDTAILKVKASSAIMKITNVRYNRKDEIIDISYAFYRGDYSRIKLETVLDPEANRVGDA